eukprot:34402-Amphidinium_carterae.1
MDAPWQEWLFYYIAASGDTVTESATLKKTLFQECSGQEGLMNHLEQAMNPGAGQSTGGDGNLDSLKKELGK